MCVLFTLGLYVPLLSAPTLFCVPFASQLPGLLCGIYHCGALTKVKTYVVAVCPDVY